MPATKRQVAISGATFARFENDHIVEECVTLESRALLTALGIITVGLGPHDHHDKEHTDQHPDPARPRS